MKIISGNSNIELSKEISEYLKIQLSERGIGPSLNPPTKIIITKE